MLGRLLDIFRRRRNGKVGSREPSGSPIRSSVVDARDGGWTLVSHMETTDGGFSVVRMMFSPVGWFVREFVHSVPHEGRDVDLSTVTAPGRLPIEGRVSISRISDAEVAVRMEMDWTPSPVEAERLAAPVVPREAETRVASSGEINRAVHRRVLSDLGVEIGGETEMTVTVEENGDHLHMDGQVDIVIAGHNGVGIWDTDLVRRRDKVTEHRYVALRGIPLRFDENRVVRPNDQPLEIVRIAFLLSDGHLWRRSASSCRVCADGERLWTVNRIRLPFEPTVGASDHG